MMGQQNGKHENLLTERKPGTPTKRQSGNSNWGEENKTTLGNRPDLFQTKKKNRKKASEAVKKEEQVQTESKTTGVAAGDSKPTELKACPLGTCIPTCRGEISPVELPEKLQRRLRDLEEANSSRTTQEDKEANAALRRQARLDQLVERQRGHSKHVQELKTAKMTAARFEDVPAFLPAHLKERLSTFRVPTKEAILRKEKIVAGRRDMLLEAKVQAIRAEQAKRQRVLQTRNEFVANNVDFTGSVSATQLPKKLSERLESLKPSWTPESILNKEATAAQRRNELVAAKVDKLRAHDKLSSDRAMAKATQAKFQQEEIPSFLPDKLKNRLLSMRIPTNETILKKEKLAALRKKLHDEQKSFDAKTHQQHVASVSVMKKEFQKNMVLPTTLAEAVATPVPLPARFQKRLNELASAHKSAREILAKAEKASVVRANKIEGVVALCAEHNCRVEKICQAKQFQPRFSNNAGPSFLPEKLRDRLATIKRRTPDAILRKNTNAALRAKIHTTAKASMARSHQANVSAALALKKGLIENGIDIVAATTKVTVTTLPKRLQERANALQSSWSAESILNRLDRASENRAKLIQEKRTKAKTHNKLALAVRLQQNTQQARFTEIPEFLPDTLKQRLASITRPKDGAILRRHARAASRKELLLESIRQNAKAQSLRGERARALKTQLAENEIDLSGESIPFAVPSNVLAKLTPVKKSAQSAILDKEEKASQTHDKIIRERRSKAKKHQALVKERLANKDTEGRFNDRFVAEFVPDHLKEKLNKYTKPKPEAIYKKLQLNASRAQRVVEAKAFQAKLHQQHVQDVINTHFEYRERMELLTRGLTSPVKLPQHLAARVNELQAKVPTAQEILAKEERASVSRSTQLKERVSKLEAHSARVAQVRKAKTSQPRFSTEQIETSPVPKHLKERLKTFRTPTREAMEGKHKRAQQRHERAIVAKVDAAVHHSKYVEQVHDRKKEFSANNLTFLGLDDERVESPEIPEKLRKKLDAHAQKFSSPLKSPEDIQRKQTAVENQRESILSDIVSNCKQHSEKVKRVLAEHNKDKSTTVTAPTMVHTEEVPETDE